MENKTTHTHTFLKLKNSVKKVLPGINLHFIVFFIFAFTVQGLNTGFGQAKNEEREEACQCSVPIISGSIFGTAQTRMSVDSVFCVGETVYLEIVNPDLYLNSDSVEFCVPDPSEGIVNHRIHFSPAPGYYVELLHVSNSPLPDSINLTDLINDFDPTWLETECSGSDNYLDISYSFAYEKFDPFYPIGDSCTSVIRTYFNCASNTSLNTTFYFHPSQSSCNPITVFTNHSGSNSKHFEWYTDTGLQNFYSDLPSVVITDPNINNLTKVVIDSNFSTCLYGFDTSSTTVDYKGFSALITNNGSLTIDCSDPTSVLNFPDLFLIDSNSYTNHTFQWYERINGILNGIPGETNAALRDIDKDASYYILVTNTLNDCYDASNYLTVTGISPELYTLGIDGGTNYCLGDISPELDFIPALPFPFPSTASITVFDDGVSQSNDLSINSEGYYYVELEFEGGCKPYSDSLLVDLDTIICDSGFVISPNNFICISDPVAMINRGPKDDSITYSWSFPGGTPSQYTGYYPPLVNYASSGAYTLQMIMTSTVSTDTFTKYIYVNDNCCEHDDYLGTNLASTFDSEIGEADEITIFTDGGTFDGQYRILGTIVLKDGIYTINDGSTFYVDSECNNCDYISQINESCRVFDYTDKTQIIVQNATLNIGDAEFRSSCENMWYGVAAVEGSSISSLNNASGNNALIMDAMAGITICDLDNEYEDIYQLDQVTFTNNVIGVFDIDRASYNFNYVRNSHFDVDTALMKSPYQDKHGLFGLNLYGFSYYSIFSNNFISNHIYGYYSDWMGDPNNSYRIKNNTIRDFQIAGIAMGGTFREVSEISNNTFIFPDYHLGNSSNPISYSGLNYFSGLPHLVGSGPLYFTNGTDQILGVLIFGKQKFEGNKFYGNRSINSSEKQTGAYIGVMDTALSLHPLKENAFHGLNFGIQHASARTTLKLNTFTDNDQALKILFSTNVTTGLFYPYILIENEFKENGCAIEISDFGDPLTINENLFLDNDTAISVLHDDNTNPLDMVMNCNKFQLDSTESYVRYGLFVHSGADMEDIGGDGFITIPENPSGNGWPIDPSSPGYSGNPPSTTGNPNNIDVTLWDSPANWYSVFDYDSSSNWKYWRYDNEFVGEHDGSASPSWKVDYPNGNPQIKILNSECPAYLQIVFPQQRVLELRNQAEKDGIIVFPNPASNQVSIQGIDIVRIKNLQLVNMAGQTQKPIWNKENEIIRIETTQMENGIWLILIDDLDGNRRVGKVLINK